MEDDYDCVYVSPHLDDVAFSAPGTIRRHRSDGETVLELVLFSRAGEGASDEVRETYETRRDEEQRAADRGGWDVRFAGFVDAPFRPHPHRDFNAIVWGESPDDDAIVDRLATRIAETVEAVEPREVVGPLGVGRHIDHRLAHRATREAAGATSVWWYEDRPYGCVPEAVELRLAELGVDIAFDLEAFLETFWEAPYVDEHLDDPDERTTCRRNFRRLARRVSRSDASVSATSRIEKVDEPGDIWEVVFSHRSQIKAFLGGEWVFKRACRGYSERVRAETRYLERQWSLS